MKNSKTNLFSNLKNKVNLKLNNVQLGSSEIKTSLTKLSSKLKDKVNIKKITFQPIIKVIGDTINPKIWFEKMQDVVERLVSNDASHVLLKQPKFWATSITWLISGGTVFAITWFAIAETDEVVIASGKLEPKGGVINVQMPLEGIAREILAKEGETVKKGQVLIRLDTEITQARQDSLEKSLEFNTSIMEKFAFLVEQGAVSEVQYMQQQARVEDIKTKIKSNLVQLKYQEILAPVGGKIFKLQPKGPGYVATTSQPVLQIVPLDNLVARVEIASNKIGFIKIGKEVEINIDSFPANDFGVVDGTLTSIGSDALTPIPSQGKGYRFPAEIKLNTQYLELDNGERLPLQTGMSLTANIKLRKVTYLQLFLNKFSDRTDSLKAM